MAAALVWFRRDLRLHDNPALDYAVARGGQVVPVFVWSPEEEGEWPPGGASRWWLHQSLAALSAELARRGSRLILRRGPCGAALAQLARETEAGAVVWNRCYEPAAIARDSAVKAGLREAGLDAQSVSGSLLHEPWELKPKSGGGQFKVFTPFWKASLNLGRPAAPSPAPARVPAPAEWPQSLELADLELEPTLDWAAGFRDTWQPGEAGAAKALERFRKQALANYKVDRDRPDLVGSSLLSPHLAFGELSPRQIWHAIDPGEVRSSGAILNPAVEPYLRQLGWRDFAYHLLYHFPHTVRAPLRSEYARFPWLADQPALRAWQRGRTGYPLVDAGMRQLWQTGWMHNRVRMVAASFLVKHLLLPWQAGAAWFWDTLVDADLANNTLGWQWTAGCGADAAPYFRIFNPVSQGEKFDPAGDYVRHWVPELARLPAEYIHQPWTAPAEVLRTAGVELGGNYPAPLVEHTFARTRALAALATLKTE